MLFLNLKKHIFKNNTLEMLSWLLHTLQKKERRKKVNVIMYYIFLRKKSKKKTSLSVKLNNIVHVIKYTYISTWKSSGRSKKLCLCLYKVFIMRSNLYISYQNESYLSCFNPATRTSKLLTRFSLPPPVGW